MTDSAKICPDCAGPRSRHAVNWCDAFLDQALPEFRLPRRVEAVFDAAIEKIFLALGLGRYSAEYSPADLQPRSHYFLEEMRKRGAKCEAIRSPVGWTNHFRVELDGRRFRFDMLPAAEFLSRTPPRVIDDKEETKARARRAGFPVLPGGAFWFWQTRRALEAAEKIGYPLVVKPRRGSVSRHVTTGIADRERLLYGIRRAIEYSPEFVVERYLADKSIFRATVIDFDYVACLRQIPANVIGDGAATVRELMERKNADPRRGRPDQREFIMNKLVVTGATPEVLARRGYTLDSVPPAGETVYLQKDPFIKYGGDWVEESAVMHPDNRELFRDFARFFDIRLTGIDFLADDIRVSWKEQECAILELNHVPCIDLHHWTAAGPTEDPAKPLADMFEKYYVNKKRPE
jgi:D-alanine-D-alanine ligase-like ATP-grasp enzyme